MNQLQTILSFNIQTTLIGRLASAYKLHRNDQISQKEIGNFLEITQAVVHNAMSEFPLDSWKKKGIDPNELSSAAHPSLARIHQIAELIDLRRAIIWVNFFKSFSVIYEPASAIYETLSSKNLKVIDLSNQLFQWVQENQTEELLLALRSAVLKYCDSKDCGHPIELLMIDQKETIQPEIYTNLFSPLFIQAQRKCDIGFFKQAFHLPHIQPWLEQHFAKACSLLPTPCWGDPTESDLLLFRLISHPLFSQKMASAQIELYFERAALRENQALLQALKNTGRISAQIVCRFITQFPDRYSILEKANLVSLIDDITLKTVNRENQKALIPAALSAASFCFGVTGFIPSAVVFLGSEAIQRCSGSSLFRRSATVVAISQQIFHRQTH